MEKPSEKDGSFGECEAKSLALLEDYGSCLFLACLTLLRRRKSYVGIRDTGSPRSPRAICIISLNMGLRDGRCSLTMVTTNANMTSLCRDACHGSVSHVQCLFYTGCW